MAHANEAHLYTPADEQEIKQTADTSRQIAGILGRGKEAELLLVDGDNRIKVPFQAIYMLQEILSMMAKGDSVSLIHIHAELTTQQAADFLNVSRPYFIKQLKEENGPPYHYVGRHRRVYFKDLLEYKASMEQHQNEALDALVKQAQELDMGY